LRTLDPNTNRVPSRETNVPVESPLLATPLVRALASVPMPVDRSRTETRRSQPLYRPLSPRLLGCPVSKATKAFKTKAGFQ